MLIFLMKMITFAEILKTAWPKVLGRKKLNVDVIWARNILEIKYYLLI